MDIFRIVSYYWLQAQMKSNLYQQATKGLNKEQGKKLMP